MLPAPRALLVHSLFEALAYAVGFVIYRIERRRFPERSLPQGRDLALLLSAGVGALGGSRLLARLDGAADGKTILGGILGGWIAVVIAKRALGIRRPTGDAFVLPLIGAMAVGRVGCFLAGLSDGTYGSPTTLPWGVDLGDGVSRHPVQLYEIAFLLACGAVLIRMRARLRPGESFLIFVAAYCAFRLGIDFSKPGRPISPFSLTAIQLACIAGVAAALVVLVRRRREAVARGKELVLA
jgi:phosphatidylglycerol---prolipoprotein diacylglyceryl transferase